MLSLDLRRLVLLAVSAFDFAVALGDLVVPSEPEASETFRLSAYALARLRPLEKQRLCARDSVALCLLALARADF